MRRQFLVSCFLGVLLTACGAATPTVTPTIAPTVRPTVAPTALPTQPAATSTTTAAAARTGDRLFVRDGAGAPGGRMRIVDAESGASMRDLPLGVATADWSTLYATEWGLENTTVRAISPQTGQTLRETTVTGRYRLPEEGIGAALGGLSPNGRWLALATGLTYAASTTSHLVVLDTAFAQQPKKIDLEGNFTFDALSNDGTSLYLIENVPQTATSTPGLGYKVRLYDLATATLQPGVVVDKTAISQTMSGTRQTALASPDGRWVYSLYLNQAKGPFIHALNLNERYAFCIFFPQIDAGSAEKQLLWSLTQTRDGKRLYAVNGALGIVAEVDPVQLTVRRTVTLPMAAASTPGIVARIGDWLIPSVGAKRFFAGGAAIPPDGKTLFVLGEQGGMFAVNTSDLTLRGRYLPDLPLDSVTVSPDGARLYAVSAEAGKMLRLDPASGAMLRSFAIASHQPWIVLGVG